MSPTNKSGITGGNRPKMDDVSARTQLTEVSNDLDAAVVAETPGSPNPSSNSHHGTKWHRPVGLGLLGLGVIAGILLAVHNVNLNKQAALNANQSGQSLKIKSQNIGLSSLGLTPIGLLAQERGTLTVNGDLNVTGSVILNPAPAPTGGAVAGQLYYSQAKNQLGYYNGTSFQYLQGGTTGGNTTNNISNVKNVYNVSNVSNVTNISNFTNAVTGPDGVIPMFNGSGLSDSLINENGNGVAVGATANTATRFSVTGATADSSTAALSIANSKGDVFGQFNDDGQVNLGISSGTALGNTIIEPAQDTGINGVVTGDKFTTNGAESVTSMSIYIGAVEASPYNQYQLGIYADNAGTPGRWIASSAVGGLVSNTWNTLPVSASLAANTTYWLVYTTNSQYASNNDPWYAASATPAHAFAAFTFGTGTENGMPSTFPSATLSNSTHSIYATTVGSNPALEVNSSGTITGNGPAVFKSTNNIMTAFQVQDTGGNDVLDVDTADKNVGIGTSSPTAARLTVVGATNDNTTNALSLKSSNGTTLGQVADDGSVKLGLSYGVFGSDSSGNYTGGNYYNTGNELLQAQSFTTTSGGAIKSMSTYVGQGISPTNNLYQMAIYSNVGNAPNTIIATTAVGTLVNSGWNSLPITATLAANTTYWLVYWTNVTDNHNGQNFIQGYNGPNTFYQSYAAWQSGATNGMPTTFPSGTGPSGGYETSIYATYTTPSSALSMDASGNMTSNGALTIQNGSSAALNVTDATGGTAFYVDGGSHFVGVNTNNADGYNFTVDGTTALGGLYSTKAVQIFSGAGIVLLNADTSSLTLTVGGTTALFATLALDNSHFSVAQTNAPQFVTPLNCGTTPGANVTTGSTDSAGSFTIVTGSGSPTTCDTTINFNQKYASIPKSVILTPALGIDGATVSTSATVSAVTVNGFTVRISSPAASTNYSYYYWVVQ